MSFNLGHKETILNSLSNVTINSSVFSIPGYAKISSSAITGLTCYRGLAELNEVASWSTTTGAINDLISVQIEYTTSRYQAEMVRSTGVEGHIFKIQTRLTGTTSAVMTVNIVAAWNAYLEQSHLSERPPFSITDDTGKLTITATEEHITVNSVRIFNETTKALFDSVKTITTVAFTGFGTASFLEESRQIATMYNRDPYRNQANGSDPVDLETSAVVYTMIEMLVQPPINTDGGAMHEYLGHDGLNQEINIKPIKFTVYIKDSLVEGNSNIADFIDSVISNSVTPSLITNLVPSTGALVTVTTGTNFIA